MTDTLSTQDRDPRQRFTAHRCEQSLAHYASIRCYGDGHWNVYDFEPCWDGDIDCYYRRTLLKDVNVCPWCGESLRLVASAYFGGGRCKQTSQ